MKINLPKDQNYPMVQRYIKKHTGKINKYIDIGDPCSTCITLSMCLNKSDYDILHCPLLYPIFYRTALQVPTASGITPALHSSFIKIIPLSVVFWISRAAIDYAYIDVIKNSELQFVSLRIEFDKGDI